MEKNKSNMFYGAAPILFEFAKDLRLNQTEAEKYLWSLLSEPRFKDFRFKRQHPVLFFIADFYCHKKQLIIEVDGGYHRLPIQYEYDQQRNDKLKELGLTVLRFTNEEVLYNTNQVLTKIENYLSPKSEEEKTKISETPTPPPLGGWGVTPPVNSSL